MKALIKKYIQNELKKLVYIDDEVKLNNVYPDIIEDVLCGFNEPYELNGYDCDYWAHTDKYDISGSMRFGTATITLKKGKEKSKNNTDVKSVENVDYTIAPNGSEDWETFYFTFGYGHIHQGYYQPIKAKNMPNAYNTMNDIYGTDWAFNYTQEDWNTMDDRLKGRRLSLVYAKI